MAIVDGLTHFTESGLWIDGVRDASLKTLLRQMDEGRIDKTIVNTLTDTVSFEALDALPARTRQNLFLFSSPPVKSDLKPWFLRAREKGVVGIKIHPRFAQLRVSSPQWDRVVEYSVEFDMPVMLCGFPDPLELDGPAPHQRLAHWADRYKSHTFVLGHAGSHRILEAWHMARTRENVYLDLSHTLYFYQNSSVEKDIGFVARRLDQRVLFGSDFPECSPHEALQHLERCLKDWPEADRSAITGGNWEKILRRHDAWKE